MTVFVRVCVCACVRVCACVCVCVCVSSVVPNRGYRSEALKHRFEDKPQIIAKAGLLDNARGILRPSAV